MRAARLNHGATGLVVENVPDPELRPGSAIVRLEAAFASHFITKIVDGSGGYATPPRPFTPGMDAIGTIERVADDVSGLEVGDRVYCDSYYEPQHPVAPAIRVFIGNFSLGPQSAALLAAWPDGAYAEMMCLPAVCLYPIRQKLDASASVLCRLGWFGTAFSGLRKTGFRPGAAIAINGASGLLGASAVMLALAMGAGTVYPVGRRETALRAVAAIDGRIHPVTDIASMPAVDAVLSAVDGEEAGSLEALLGKVKRRGSFVVVGAPKQPLPVNVRALMVGEIQMRGSFWFAPSDVTSILDLAESGALDLSVLSVEEYGLERIGEALAAAHRRDDPLRHVAILCR